MSFGTSKNSFRLFNSKFVYKIIQLNECLYKMLPQRELEYIQKLWLLRSLTYTSHFQNSFLPYAIRNYWHWRCLLILTWQTVPPFDILYVKENQLYLSFFSLTSANVDVHYVFYWLHVQLYTFVKHTLCSLCFCSVNATRNCECLM